MALPAALLRGVETVDALFGALCRGIVALTMVALLFVIGANVFARYFLGQGTINAMGEIPELLFPWLIAAGIVLGVQRGAHIAVDLILIAMSTPSRRRMMIGINLIVIAGYVLLMGPVLQIAEITSIEETPLLRLPRSIGFYALAFGMTGVILASTAIILRLLAGRPDDGVLNAGKAS
jgi:TRAP-type C4-dicarboxylate transport system permease small subunit